MATTQATHETVSTDAQLDDRDIRALLTPMTVIDNCGDVAGIDGLFEVTTDSGSCYTVSLRGDGECTCPDHKYRDVRCKHIRRCEFEIGVRAIPGHINLDTLDDQLGMHVTEGEPRVAMADGGLVARQSDADTEPTSTDPRDAYIPIGVDTKGGHHVYRTTDETVFAIEGGRVTQRYDVSERSVNDWIDYVADRRGWESQELYKTAADALGGAL